jgi:hypothetical protein
MLVVRHRIIQGREAVRSVTIAAAEGLRIDAPCPGTPPSAPGCPGKRILKCGARLVIEAESGSVVIVLHERPTAGATVTDKLAIAVTFHPERGYVGTAPDLRRPVIALSLGGLRRKIEAAMLPDKVIVMQLDKAARLERTAGGSPVGRLRALPGRRPEGSLVVKEPLPLGRPPLGRAGLVTLTKPS